MDDVNMVDEFNTLKVIPIGRTIGAKVCEVGEPFDVKVLGECFYLVSKRLLPGSASLANCTTPCILQEQL
jgi:hypothetical protein